MNIEDLIKENSILLDSITDSDIKNNEVDA
jgi:hypothetical protein